MTISLDKNKNTLIIVLLCIIFLIIITFLLMDWTKGITDISQILKFIVSCICVFIAWLTGKDGLDKKDTIFIRIAFAFIPFADTLLVLLQRFANPAGHSYFFLTGMGCFAVFNIVLIIRHSRNIKSILMKENKKKFIYAILSFIIIYSCSIIILIWFILPLIKNMVMKISILGYGLLLTTSLWMAWNTLGFGFFPKLNAWFIALGLTGHYLSDICIILKNHIESFAPVGRPLVWTLYATAIIMLSLSGYKHLLKINKETE